MFFFNDRDSSGMTAITGIAKLALMGLTCLTILATSVQPNNVEIPASMFNVTSDCKDAAARNGTIEVIIAPAGTLADKEFGENFAEFGFPSQFIKETVDSTIVEGPQRKCTALHFLAEEDSTYMFLCRNPGDQSLQCTIVLEP